MKRAVIVRGESSVTFYSFPYGRYALNILHDANEKIDTGLVLPVEGIGFSNYSSINLFNRPNFSKASFELSEDTSIEVSIIYM